MGVNRCVTCGAVIPEGDHICGFCQITVRSDHTIRLETPPNMVTIDTKVTPIHFRIETTAEIIVQFAKYCIFKTNMNSNGSFNHRFIWENVQKNEDLLSCEARLTEEYNRTVELIESMIIKK
jgi:hypothetical protein